MFKLTSKITIESGKIGNTKRFVIPNFLSNVEISSNWDSLVDTCTIELPKKINWEGSERLVDDGFGTSNEPALFERGDKVVVELGYDSENFQMFEGFISDIDPSSPLKLVCKDMMWYLGQIRLDKSYMSLVERLMPEPKFRTIITYLTPLLGIVNANFALRGIKTAFKFNLLDEDGLPALGNFVPTGDFRFPNEGIDTVASLLAAIKEKYDIYFWFRNNELIVDVGGRLKGGGNIVQRLGNSLAQGAKALAFRDSKVVWPFHFQRNVIENDLTYVNQERTPLIIEISGTPEKVVKDNKLNRAIASVTSAVNSVSETVGFDVLEFVQVQFSNVQGNEGAAVKQKVNFSELNKVQLLEIATRTYNNLRYTGFEGSITTFGQYPVKHGDIAQLTDDRNPEKNGAYIIRGVNTTFGVGGYRQQLSLERNVTSQLSR